MKITRWFITLVLSAILFIGGPALAYDDSGGWDSIEFTPDYLMPTIDDLAFDGDGTTNSARIEFGDPVIVVKRSPYVKTVYLLPHKTGPPLELRTSWPET